MISARGQQQRLVIARAIAINPEVILMDEPCSALDPIATARIEELIDELRAQYCIIIVTHSMAQAARVSQRTAFFHMGRLVEAGPTGDIFTRPGDSRTQDYTRKTQQIAEIRKQVEAETEAVRAERAQYAQMLGALQAQLQGAETQIDWDRLYQEDPIEWVRQKEGMREKQEKLQAIQFEQQRVAQLTQQEQQQHFESHLQAQHAKLLEIMPEWKDPAKAKAEKQLLVEFGQKTGFTPEELKAIVDHRAVVALRKAALYDQMMTKRKAITPVTNNGPRPAKPGAAGRVSQTTEATRAKQRLAKTGRVDDAASAIYQLLR